MCGLVGVLQYESEVSRTLRSKALRILFSELMLKTEVRGKDATGLYQVMANGDWMMTKKGQKVSDWLFMDLADKKCEDPITYSDVMDSWSEHPAELRTLVGHCRARTVGNVDNENNHPFAIQLDEKDALLGVHNGTIYNHEVIFDRLPNVVKRQGKVDSEAIFHLLYHLTEHGTVPMSGKIIKELGKRVDGAYACIVVNSRFPDQVSVFRDGRPIEFFMVSPLNILLIASERKFVESALEKYDFIRRFFDLELPALDTESRMLPDRDYRIFDTSIEFPSKPLTYNDFTKLEAAKGETRKYNDEIDAAWRDLKNVRPVTETAYSRSRHVTGGTGPVTPLSATTPIVRETKQVPFPDPSPPKPEDKDKGVTVDAEVVEVQIGSEAESQQIYERVKALGLSVGYDTINILAKSIGVDEMRVKGMSPLELANAVGQTHFNFGCAASRLESQEQYLSVRNSAKEILRKLERAQDKQQKAQRHIWEGKTIIQILLALHEINAGLSVKNIERVLKAFPKLGEQRRTDILQAAGSILETGETESVIAMIKSWVEESRERQRARETASS